VDIRDRPGWQVEVSGKEDQAPAAFRVAASDPRRPTGLGAPAGPDVAQTRPRQLGERHAVDRFWKLKRLTRR